MATPPPLARRKRPIGIQTFSEIIEEGRYYVDKTGQRAVVLIDEYDKPILDNITHSAVALEMREGLKNLTDITLDAKLSALCGYNWLGLN